MPTVLARKLKTTRAKQKNLVQLSPFELKDNLIHLAKENQRQSAASMLNAGRGNPNWIATTPRDAFFTFGRFAMEEARRTRDDPDLAGMPQKPGIAKRLDEFLKKNASELGVQKQRVRSCCVHKQIVKSRTFPPSAFDTRTRAIRSRLPLCVQAADGTAER